MKMFHGYALENAFTVVREFVDAGQGNWERRIGL
jgi:hypothetical protein